MNQSNLIGKILLTFFSITIVFVGYLYYLGTTVTIEPIEEVFVGGQWVRYRDYNTDFPGDVRLFDDGVYSNASPLYISGEAQSAWFSESRTPAEIVAPDGTKLWDGNVITDERYLYEMTVPFFTEADIGDYQGDATFIIYTTEYTDDNPDEPMRQYSYSASIIIADGHDSVEIDE